MVEYISPWFHPPRIREPDGAGALPRAGADFVQAPADTTSPGGPADAYPGAVGSARVEIDVICFDGSSTALADGGI